jgi:hypothetical protein
MGKQVLNEAIFFFEITGQIRRFGAGNMQIEGERIALLPIGWNFSRKPTPVFK